MMTMELMIDGMERSALDCWDDILEKLMGGCPIVFLDYDGTLTPIVEVPSKAVISDSMRGTLHRLSLYCPVALMSSRSLRDVRSKVGLDQLIYVGSGGYEVLGPWGHYVEDRGERYKPLLDQAEAALRYRIGDIRGALVERKRFAVAVHHRLVDPNDYPRLKTVFEDIARRYPELEGVMDKRTFELRPNMDWHKGRAVNVVIDMIGLKNNAVPMYVGDDVTDEDAFKAIGERGINILVTEAQRPTAAEYVLFDFQEVQELLERLIVSLTEGREPPQ